MWTPKVWQHQSIVRIIVNCQLTLKEKLLMKLHNNLQDTFIFFRDLWVPQLNWPILQVSFPYVTDQCSYHLKKISDQKYLLGCLSFTIYKMGVTVLAKSLPSGAPVKTGLVIFLKTLKLYLRKSKTWILPPKIIRGDYFLRILTIQLLKGMYLKLI